MTDTIGSHAGMPYGMRTIISIGDVNGIIDNITAKVEFGSAPTTVAQTKPMIMGISAMLCSCDASCMLSTAEPMAAYIEA